MPNSIENRPPYILFADDDADTLKLLKFYNEHRGWKGEYVSTAQEIIEKINENCSGDEQCYDAIVADVNYLTGTNNWPSITGIAAAKEIQKSGLQIPIVFVSAFVNTIIREQIRAVNGEIFDKPFNPSILFKKLEQLVRWNRVSLYSQYEGEDRRKMSINTAGYNRRNTDKSISISAIIQNTLSEVRHARFNKK